MSSDKGDDHLLDEAAHWMALLASGQVSEQEQQAFRRWHEDDPRRAEIYQRLTARVSSLEHEALRRLPRESLLQSLNAPSSRRRMLSTSLGLLGVLAGGALLLRASDWSSPPGLLATSTGQRLNTVLVDGSQLTLAPRTQVLPQLEGAQRVLQLEAGQLFVRVAPSARDFFVTTRQGRTQVYGSGLLVRETEELTQVTVLEAQAEVVTLAGERHRLRAGQQARFNQHGLLSVQAALGDATAWTRGLLTVNDQTLGEVVATLRDYRPGVLRISPEAAQIRLSGIFPLDDSSRTLQLLNKSLPIRITYRSAYWVSIDVS